MNEVGDCFGEESETPSSLTTAVVFHLPYSGHGSIYCNLPQEVRFASLRAFHTRYRLHMPVHTVPDPVETSTNLMKLFWTDMLYDRRDTCTSAAGLPTS